MMTAKSTWKVRHKGIWYPVLGMHDDADSAKGEKSKYKYHVDGRDKPIAHEDVEAIDMGDGEVMEKATLVPPDHGVIQGLDPKSNIDFAKRHEMHAMEAAKAGFKDQAVHHWAQSKKFRADSASTPLARAEHVKEIPLDELIDEHQELVGDLKSNNKKKLKAQAKDQEKELAAYKKEKAAKKCERIEVSPDGKITRDVGIEPLDKQPEPSGVKKGLVAFWDLLKAKVSADDAFLSMEDEPEQQGQEQQGQEQQGQEQQGQGGDPEQAGAEQQTLSPEEEQQLQQVAAQQGQPDDQNTPPVAPENEQPQKPSPEEIAQMMADEGYSESEVAYVMHGHVPPVSTAEDHAAVNEQAQGEQDRFLKQRDADLKHGHATRLQELEAKKKEAELAAMDPESEKEHAKRLKELEYEKAKKKLESEDHDGERDHKRKLRDMELEAKKAEIDSRLDNYDQSHKRRMADLEYEKAKRDSSEIDPTNQLKAEQAKFELEMEKARVHFEMEMDKRERELELKYKEKELQLNLQLKAEAAKIKGQMQEEQMHADHEVNMQVKEHQAKHKISEAKKAPEVTKKPIPDKKK